MITPSLLPSRERNLLISSRSSLINLTLGSSLTVGLLMIFLARLAYRKVLKVSALLHSAGEIATIIARVVN